MSTMIPALTEAAFIVPNRTAAIRSALDSGWVILQYRKADGSIVVRLGTRNPTLIKAFGLHSDNVAIGKARSEDEWGDNVLYFDHAAGGLRSFCRIDLKAAGIPESPPEINH